MERVYVIETLLAAGFFLGATVIYGCTPWHRTFPGRILFVVLMNFTVILCLIVASYFLGDYEGRSAVRFIIYTLTALNGLIILIAVVAGQVRGSKDV